MLEGAVLLVAITTYLHKATALGFVSIMVLKLQAAHVEVDKSKSITIPSTARTVV
jgi:hypothetical protein